MDDWEKKYWSLKQQQKQNNSYTRMPPANPNDLPHYEPAHITNNKQRFSQQQHSNGWREIDPIGAMYANMERLQNNLQSQVVFLRPGVKYYKSVQSNSFGSTMPLVKDCGVYNESNQKEFEMKNTCKCYIIDNLNTVDLSNLDPNRLVELVELRAPWIGSILVEKRYIIQARTNNGPQILKG